MATQEAGIRPDLYFSADISHVDALNDDTVMVYGIPCMPGVLDNDNQMVDPTWLKQALGEWFAGNPNIREMHQPIAAGKGTDLDWKGDVPYLTAHVVDPIAAKKVRARVLRAFSIGIKKPLTKKQTNAPKGLIVGGKIIEVTLCDRPCIPGSDILDFKADVFKMAGYIAEDEILDYQRGVAWKSTRIPDLAKHDFDPGVSEFGDPNKTHDKESSKVAETDTTKIPAPAEAGEETVEAATESAATDVEKSETDLSPQERILADLEKSAASSTFCAECDKSMPILDGKEETVKGHRMLVGKDSAGHKLTKFVGAQKADDPDEEKSPEAEAVKAEGDEVKADDPDAGKGVIVVAPQHAEPSAEATKSDAEPNEEKSPEADEAKSDEPEDGKTVEVPVVKAAATGEDILKAALTSLLADAGIDLAKVAQHTKHARIERLGAAFAEAQEILDLVKSDQTGGTTTVSGLDPDTAGRLRSCLAEINALAGQMTGTPADGAPSAPGLDMGVAEIAKPTEHIDLQNYSAEADITKTSKTEENGASTALDVAELGKSLAAEFTKSITPLVERLEQVEYQTKPASPPVLHLAERPSAFVGDQAQAGQDALKTAMASIEGLSDEARAQLAAAFLTSRPDWPLAASS